METLKAKIYLGSTLVKKYDQDKPYRQFFSLVYLSKDGKENHIDLSSLRPDIQNHIQKDKKYNATLYFSKDTNENSEEIYNFKYVVVGTVKFVKIR